MGKKMTVKDDKRRDPASQGSAGRKNAEPQARGYLRLGAMLALVLVGVGAMAGMAAFNATAKPRRNMKWYLEQGAVQVAAPPQGEGYAVTTDRTDGKPAATIADAVEPADTADIPADVDEPADTMDMPASVVEPADTADVPADVAEPADTMDMPAGVGEPADTMDMPADTDEPADTADIPADAAEPAATDVPEVVADPDAEAAPADDGAEAEPVTGPVTLTITAVGDCTFGGEVGSKGARRFRDCVEESGYDYFFQNVRHIFEADDLTIVNLEGALTSQEKPKKHGYIFKADPDCVKILTGSSVELCNLANNHSLDYGPAGLQETAKVLEENGVGYCGFTEAYNTVIKGVRVTALGFTKWDHTEEDIARAVSAAREGCDLLIVNMHWGWERQYDNDEKQTAMGHAAIDAGADLVIGTHPHVYQGIEQYKGRYIVYSLGNFCFAGNANPKDKRCLIFQQTFSFTPGMGIAQANFMDAGINIIPANISSDKSKNDFIPTIMTAEEGGELLKAVAGHSKRFSFSKALWMKDNYMITYGLIKPEEQNVADAEVGPETAEANADGGDAPDAQSDGDAAAEEDGASAT